MLPRPPEPKPALPVSPQLKVKVEQFTFTGYTLYPEEALQAQVQEFIGKELDFEALNEAATKVRAFYRSRGYFLAQAYLPQQAIRNGKVEIAVIEGRIGQVELDRREGTRISEGLLIGILGAHFKQGQIITETGSFVTMATRRTESVHRDEHARTWNHAGIDRIAKSDIEEVR